MKLFLSFIAVVFIALPLWSQDKLFVEIDSLYREDQFYAGVTYNLLTNKPIDVSQTGFSSGFHLGYIRDIPLNKRRNVSIGLGIGYSGNSFNQNLQINRQDDGNVIYTVLKDEDFNFSKNKFALHLIEIPFEFRWRTSTVADYKFWRIYTGFKVGYLVAHTTKYIGSPSDLKHSNVDHFNNLQYGLTASFGYNTVNFHVYYGLNAIFNDKAIIIKELGASEQINMRAVKIGLIFYIL